MAAKKKPTAKKKPAAKKKPVPVMLVGVRGAGITTLLHALAPDAPETVSALGEDDPMANLGSSKGGKKRRPAVVQVRETTLGGVPVALHDVPGDTRSSDTQAFDASRFGKLLSALEAARVIVHLIDATDPDAERLGGRLDRWIYGSWHDDHAVVVPVLTKCDAASDGALDALRAAWPGALAVSATKGAGLDALREHIARAANAKRAKAAPTPFADRSLVDLQLALIARTRSGSFDGAAIAADLRARVERAEVAGVVFLREGEGTYQRDRLERADDGLRFLGRLHTGVWDADVLHLLTAKPAQAKRLVARAVEQWGAAEASVVGETIVRARWDVANLTAVTPAGEPTAQDLQIEIVRRASYNSFRGDRVVASLLQYPGLWRAVAFGRLRNKLRDGAVVHESPTWFNTVTEIGGGSWNADELWVVTPDAAAAERVRFLGAVHWFADNIVTLEGEEARRVAGVEAPGCVVELWWD
jgi:hypothetical protein